MEMRASACLSAILITSALGIELQVRHRQPANASGNGSLPEAGAGGQRPAMVAGGGEHKDVQDLQTMVLLSDLSQKPGSYYRSFNSSDNVAANARAAFEEFVKKTQLAEELQVHELRSYMNRFIDHVSMTTKSVLGDARKLNETWLHHCKNALEEQKPVVTETLVKSINSAKLRWTAASQVWSQYISKSDAATRCGVLVSQKSVELQALWRRTRNATARFMDQPDRSFDVRQKWGHCAGVVGQVRNQGHCGSCWAYSAAGVIEDRLCIGSNGSFTGPSAAISASFLTSCTYQASRHDGCKGGHPLQAFQWAAQKGVPTGGDGSSSTCVPDFGRGSSLEHFTVQDGAPPCPGRCTDRSYPRLLNDDRFFPRGMSQGRILPAGGDNGLAAAKAELLSGGSISCNFGVTADFMSYRKGIWRPASEQLLGYHATRAIGYGSDHILGVNSWGKNWGNGGLFKIEWEEVLEYVVPGPIDGSGRGYPLPIPGGGPPPEHQDARKASSWRVTAGKCRMDEEGCVLSPHFPSMYRAKERCIISTGKSSIGMEVRAFSTEAGWDILTVNGRDYSGVRGPHGVVPKGDIVWRSDEAVESGGWKLCPPSQQHLQMHAIMQTRSYRTAIKVLAAVLGSCVVLWLAHRAAGLCRGQPEEPS